MNDKQAIIEESQVIEILGITLGALSLFLAWRRYQLNQKMVKK